MDNNQDIIQKQLSEFDDKKMKLLKLKETKSFESYIGSFELACCAAVGMATGNLTGAALNYLQNNLPQTFEEVLKDAAVFGVLGCYCAFSAVLGVSSYRRFKKSKMASREASVLEKQIRTIESGK